MTNRQTPPGLTSISWMVFVKPLGPHHLATCCGSVHIRNTSSRGASNTRVATISCCPALAAMLLPALVAAMLSLLGLELAQVVVQAIEALIPETPIVLHPVGDLLQ